MTFKLGQSIRSNIADNIKVELDATIGTISQLNIYDDKNVIN